VTEDLQIFACVPGARILPDAERSESLGGPPVSKPLAPE
jgi:hypothetical protein